MVISLFNVHAFYFPQCSYFVLVKIIFAYNSEFKTNRPSERWIGRPHQQTLNTKTPKRFQDNFENWEKWFISRNHQNTNVFLSHFLSFLHLLCLFHIIRLQNIQLKLSTSLYNTNNSLAWISPNISILKWMQGIPVNSHINQFQYQPHLQFYLFHK